MADEPQVVENSEITPEDFDGEQDTPKAASTPAETKTEEKSEDKVPETKTPEVKETEDQEVKDPPVEETPPEPKAEPPAPLAKADERKQQLNTEIRDLVAQRNALKAEVEKANAEVYQPATEEELLDQGMSATDAKVEALRQEIEVSKYNERVAEAQLTISHEANRVLQDFSIFNDDSPDFDKELAEQARDFVASNLIKDPNTGQIIGSNIGIYKYYETLARASGISAIKGQMKGQQNTEQMLANADTGPSAAPPKKAPDPLAELWAEPL